jgi:phage terminase large subunit GpA-like protein
MVLAVYDTAYIKNVLKLNISKIRMEGRLALKPPKDISVSDWADENYILTENSSKPGKWNTKGAPHTKEILNTIKDPKVRQISYMKSSQCAGTECLIIITSYLIDIDPCHIMIMQPTDKEAEDFVNQKLDPAFDEMECLKKKISKKKSREGQNSTLRKKFIGGYLSVVSGLSNSSTRQRSARVTIGDDIEGIKKSAAVKEGDPVIRLMKRSTTFPDKLNINISTPTIENESRIQALYEQSDRRHYFIRCPYCNFEQELVPEQLTWKKDYDMFKKVTRHYEETVRYQCINEMCGAKLTEGERIEALQKGYWKAERPWITYHAGFYIGEISSTLSTMENVARAITDAKCDIIFDEKGQGSLDVSRADQDKLEALVNTVFGRTYKKLQGEETDPLDLMARVEDYIDINDIKIPNEVLMLDAAVDVQGGRSGKVPRLEIKVMGYGLEEEAWVIYTGTIPGDPAKKEVWLKLDEFWERKWFRKDGVELDIIRKFVDAGYLTTTVTEYCKGRQREGIFAVKGSNKYDAPMLPRHATILKGGALLITLGTQNIKKELFARLNRVKEFGPRYTHFTRCFCGSSYFKQLTSEVAVTKTTGLANYIVYEPKDKHADNEALDLMVYCYAAMKHVMPNFPAIKKMLDRESREVRNEKEPVKDPQETVSTSRHRRRGDRTNQSISNWRYS